MSTALALSDGSRSGSLVVSPQSFPEVMEFAKQMSMCSFVPRHLRNKPADCLAVCLQALRWEMDPFSVAQKTYFVSDGAAPGYEAQLITAVIYARAPIEGRLNIEWSGSGNDLTCTVTGKFRGDPSPKVKTCRIATITTKNSPLWKSDPEQQLAYFTTRAWARLYAPDVIMGVYTPDELTELGIGAEHARDVTPPASRLDALESTFTDPGDPPAGAQPPAASPDGADPSDAGGSGGSAWDNGVGRKSPDMPIGLKNTGTGAVRYFGAINDWCAALASLVDAGVDGKVLWEANKKISAALRERGDAIDRGNLDAARDYALSDVPLLDEPGA